MFGTPHVLVEVRGGVARVSHTAGVEVLVIDYDNAKEEGVDPVIPVAFQDLPVEK